MNKYKNKSYLDSLTCNQQEKQKDFNHNKKI